MREIKCHFDKAQYLIGEPVSLCLDSAFISPRIRLFGLAKEVMAELRLLEGQVVIEALCKGNYGIVVEEGTLFWEGAFDIVSSMSEVTRYGFLADFLPEDSENKACEWMKDLHINAVQFYDWMYRHDSFLPPKEEYLDPLGRKLSMVTVKKRISDCVKAGMRPFAYGAVYAATEETYRLHRDWAMYTMDGEPMRFADWLFYMDISESSGWTELLTQQYISAIRIGFFGIHMDTYGFPKHVWNYTGKPIDLSEEFPKLISRIAKEVKAIQPHGGVIFNAVNNWPVESVANAPQDAVYIEVWPPNTRYIDLYTLIREAKLLSGKQVVLAAYLKPFSDPSTEKAEAAFRLCWAAICASGGTQLVLGEDAGILQDSYYVNYAHLRKEFLCTVQKYCDFLVRYADLMYNDAGADVTKTASGGINEDIQFSSNFCDFSVDAKENTVWTIVRQSAARISVQLVNLCGNTSEWNEGKNTPREVPEIDLKLRIDRPVLGIYCASPDGEALGARELSFSCYNTPEGRVYKASLPMLKYWNTVWAELG